MDCLISKKGEGVGGYSVRCYRLRNCELMQYKKGIEDFQLCTDKTIKRRYNIYNVSSISIGHARQPYILSLSYNEETSIDLKFNDINKKQKIDHAKFCAWYRILCASLNFVQDCRDRPLPSNTCFTLYYLLQNLYHHKDILTTQYIFQKRLQGTSSKQHVEKLYYGLMVHSRKYSNDLIKSNSNGMDIYLLSKTLIYTLQNMPTSLFCDDKCNQLTTFMSEILYKSTAQKRAQDPDGYSSAIKHIPEYEDVDIYVMDKDSLKLVKEKLLQMYGQNRKQYKKRNGFDLFNRYGFMTILFLLLSNISSNLYYKNTTMSAAQLAIQFNEALQSKQYLYHCRTETLTRTNQRGKSSKNKKYEDEFVRMLKILIYFAPEVFPDLRRVKWRIKQLVVAQSAERIMVKRYNENFSRETKNQYYIASVLRNSVDYGDFDGKYYVDQTQASDANKHLLSPSKLGGKQYHMQRLPSYHEQPAYNSDIGISEREDNNRFSDVDEEEEEDEEKYGNNIIQSNETVHIAQKITFGDNNSDDGYAQDDEKESVYNNNEENAYNNNDYNDDAYGYNNNNGSWLANCELCLYAPIMSLFGNANGNGNGNYNYNYNNNEAQYNENEYNDNANANANAPEQKKYESKPEKKYDNNNSNNNNNNNEAKERDYNMQNNEKDNYNLKDMQTYDNNNENNTAPTEMLYRQKRSKNTYETNEKGGYGKQNYKQKQTYSGQDSMGNGIGYQQTKQAYKEMRKRQHAPNDDTYKPQINYAGGTKIQQYKPTKTDYANVNQQNGHDDTQGYTQQRY